MAETQRLNLTVPRPSRALGKPDRAASSGRRATPRWAAALLTDASMLTAAVIAAEAAGQSHVAGTSFQWLITFSLLVLVFSYLRGMYAVRMRVQILDNLRAVVASTTLAAMSVLSLRVLALDDPWVAAQTARLWAFASVYLLAGRAALVWKEREARRRGESACPTLIIGAGRVGRLAARRLLEHPELGLRPIGFLDKEPLERDGALPVLGASWDLDAVVAQHGVRHAVVTFSTAPQPVFLRTLQRCKELGVELSIVPRFYEKVGGRIGIEYIGGLPLMRADSTDPHGWQFSVKYAVDRVVAALLLMLLAPVLFVAGLAVWRSLGRPIFFCQPRVGRDGRIFRMVKFRTMNGSPEGSGEADADWAEEQVDGHGRQEEGGHLPAESRCTRAGLLLRRYSIDELPQLWNVLVGEMSLVGPRPERIHYVERFEESVYRYGDRHRVKAGITGWSQVHGLRGTTSLADRVEWDNYYIENWSFWLDVKILLLTVGAFRSAAD
jgi:exopolysaccharide biosynthesis polyprenyl glycosylphosphotransferase